jgi:metal-dependent hydrolase (beta-lactamase superfamily II)
MAIDLAKAKYPGKPIKYVILTHHHMDHAGGLRAYAAQGATIVVGKGSGEHFRSVLAAPFRRNPDVPSKDLRQTPIVEVADKQTFTDGQRQVSAYLIENPHAASYLIGYSPDPGQAALVAAVKKIGITPAKFAGGHGSTGDYQPLADLEGK